MDNERRCVYRVYQTYHEASESGTLEYGYYSDLSRAKERALKVWGLKKYGEIHILDPSGSIHGESNGWGSGPSIYVSMIEIDVDTQDNNVGYT